MGSKKKSKSKSSSTTEQKPLDIVMPGYNQIAQGVSQGLNDIQGVDYNGDFLAQAGALQNAVPGAYLQAGNMAGSLIPQMQNVFQQSQQGLNFGDSPLLQQGLQSFGGTNPGGMQDAVNAAINPYMQQLTQNVLPSLQSAGIESGAYGGSRSQQTLPGMAIADAGESAQRVAAALAYEDFQNQQNRILEGYGLSTQRGLGEGQVMNDRYGMAPEMMDSIMRLAGGQAEYANMASQADLGNRQLAIDNALKQFQYDMTRPFMGYDVAGNILGNMTQGYGTTQQDSKSSTVEKTGGLGNVVAGLGGLAMGIAGMPMAGGGSLGGQMLGGLLGGGGGGGAILPGVIPQMSSRTAQLYGNG
jgi:hypothetical protein